MTTTRTMVRNTLGRGLVALGLWLGVATASQATDTVVYYHTDALGSPVAVTNAGGAVIEHRTYEPYGKQLSPLPPQDGPGYTGHVYDAATGLDYMQQRYYDPAIGRFLSVDPVNADAAGGTSFNRYWYANNNPYKFKDPDGRDGAVFYTQELYQMAMPTDTASANIGVAAGAALYGGIVLPAAAEVVYAYRGAIAVSVAMAGNPIGTLDALEALAAQRAAIAAVAEQSKHAAEIASKVKKLLSAIIVTSDQTKTHPKQGNQDPPPDTTQHKRPPPPPPPPPPRKEEDLAHEQRAQY